MKRISCCAGYIPYKFFVMLPELSKMYGRKVKRIILSAISGG